MQVRDWRASLALKRLGGDITGRKKRVAPFTGPYLKANLDQHQKTKQKQTNNQTKTNNKQTENKQTNKQQQQQQKSLF